MLNELSNHSEVFPSLKLHYFLRTGSIRDLLLTDMTFKQVIHLNLNDTDKKTRLSLSFEVEHIIFGAGA